MNLLLLLRIRWRLILLVAIVSLAVAVGVIFSLSPRYGAQAIVTLDQRTNTVTDTDSVLSKLSGDAATVQAQLQLLRSRSFLSQVVVEANLENDPLLNPVLAKENPTTDIYASFLTAIRSLWAVADNGVAPHELRDEIVDNLARGLSVSPLGSAISIEYTSKDAGQTAKIANAIAKTYIADQLNTKVEASETATTFLSNRINELGSQLKAAEAELAAYRLRTPPSDATQGLSSIDQQISGISSQLIASELELTERTTRLNRIQQLQSGTGPVNLAEVVESPLIAQLQAERTDLRRQDAELSVKYGPRHPRIIDVRSKAAGVDQKIAEELKRVTQMASNELTVAEAKVKTLQQTLQGLQSRSVERDRSVALQNQSLAALKQFEDRVTSTRSLYQSALSRFNEIEDREEVQRPDARIISSATVPRTPSFPPSKVLMLGAAVPASLFLGFFVALVSDLLGSGFRTTSQIEQALSLPVLAATPEVRGRKGRSSLPKIIRDYPLSPYAETMRGIEMGLFLPDVQRQPKVILITSALPREGKSTLALSFARSAAQSGKRVVLVDCDLRRPSIGGLIEAEKMKHGLVAALTGAENLESCMRKDVDSNVQLLLPEKIVNNPAILLGSAEMEKLVQDLRKSADWVIIDSAPLLPVNDTKLLIPMVDTMLLLVRWEKTPRSAAIAAAKSLFDLRAPVAGVVVTRADPGAYYGYSYGIKNYAAYARYYRN